ncbi:hypothetical protein LCGC14_0774680, partial [marine sediment metagenome]
MTSLTKFTASNMFFRLLLGLSALALTGCQQDKSDLTAYIAQIKSQQKSDIPPIPVMKPYDKFDYAAAALRDPFIPTVIDVPPPQPEPVIDNVESAPTLTSTVEVATEEPSPTPSLDEILALGRDASNRGDWEEAILLYNQ